MQTLCSVDGCPNWSQARGWCVTHYGRWRQYGDPLAPKRGRWDGHVKTQHPCDNCGKPVIKKRLCSGCYARKRRRGDVNATPLPRPQNQRQPVGPRLWAKVQKGSPSDCWLWTGHVGSWGYGSIGLNGKVERVHRVVFYLTHGHWPTPVCRHTCDVPACCNPAHLIEGTVADNNRDKVERGRDRHPTGKAHGTYTKPESRRPGESNGSAKLTEEQVLAIRALWADGRLMKAEIAELFGINQSTVYNIVRRKTWTYLEDTSLGVVLPSDLAA